MRTLRMITMRRAAPKRHVVTALITSASTAIMCGITVLTTLCSSTAANEDHKEHLAENDAKFLAIEKARELREIEHLAEFKKLSSVARGGGGDGDTGKWKTIREWFLGLLLKAHHDADGRSKISVDDIIDQCRAFYFAGQETTNGLLSWTVFFLALHPDWQEEARKEVLQLFGKRNPNPDGIAKLKTVSQ